MSLDNLICNLPLVGTFFKRIYSYFRKNILFTDLIHMMLGVGVGFIIASKELFMLGTIFIVLGCLGHVYAFMKG